MLKYIFVLLISLLLVAPIYANQATNTSQVTLCNNIAFNYRYPFVSVYVYINNSLQPVVILGFQSQSIKTPFTINKIQTLQNDCPSCKFYPICPELNNTQYTRHTSTVSVNISGTGTGPSGATCTVMQTNCASD